mgnify:CR=1 FL=1
MNNEEERVIIRYRLKEKKTRLFSQNFVTNNKNKYKLIINKEEKELIEFYHKIHL